MSSGQQQDVLDPRLGAAPQYPDVSHQPYYYPSPQTHTPQRSGAANAPQNDQTSPEGVYQQPLDQNVHAAGVDPANDGEGQGAEDGKRSRACEACRNLKVRCDQDPAHPEIPCKRCAKAGRQCIITQPSRKRQKKADGRVAELEKKLDALTAALHHQQHVGVNSYNPSHADVIPARTSVDGISNPYMHPNPLEVTNASPSASMPPQKRKRTDVDDFDPPTVEDAPNMKRRLSGAYLSSSQGNDLPRYLPNSSPEEFYHRINSIVSPRVAATVFTRYTSELAPHMPAVVFPPEMTADRLFREKPILYVCVLSSGAHGLLDAQTSREITREAVGAIADCVVRNGAKSLELIQAMQVAALWYKPPERAEQTNFYQVIHMAAVMALDIGLGKRFNPAKAKRGFGGPNANYAPGPGKNIPQDSDTLEARRAWLCCYYLCASASMVLRRPNLVRWTNYMKECIEVLESHSDAYPSDKMFCQYVKIQHICEDIGLQFLMDDNTANISITDPKVSYALNVLESQLKDWKENIPPECQSPSLTFFEHVTSLYLHEIALHFNHNVEDFRMPFTEESLKSVNGTSATLTHNQMAAIEACLKAAHGMLDTILSFEIQVVKTLPMLIYFVRVVYALVILIKMHVAVCTPNSEMGKMMKPEDLHVDYYVDKLLTMFSFVAEAEEPNTNPKILRILNVLRDWYVKHKEHVAAQQRGEQPSSQESPQEEGQYNQTPLHLLSQVATGNQQMSQNQSLATTASTQDWTFPTPNAIDYPQNPKQQSSNASAGMTSSGSSQYPTAYSTGPSIDQGMADPMYQPFGWGSGFEQAMDMALYDTDGLQGAGLDNWFLGESMAPFGFNGDMTGAQQW